jgi:tRNA 2-thiouridine synthesizing protein A
LLVIIPYNQRMTTHQILDLTGLKCPLPALKTRKALKALKAGFTIEVITTDPLATLDLQALAQETGDKLLKFELYQAGHRFIFEKSSF